MARSRLKLGVGLLVVAVMPSVLVACGSGGSTSSDGSTVKVISLGQHSSSTLGQDAAAYLGMFKAAGLSVHTTYGQDAVSALAAGSADYAVTSPNRIVGAVAKGLKATIIGPAVNSFVQYVIVNPKSDVTSLDDFKGGKIGISQFGSAGHYSTLKIADALHWSKSDYTLVPLGDLDSLSAALASGKIDAFMWSAEAAFAIDEKGEGRIIGNVADVTPSTPLNVLVVTDKYLKQYPSKVRSFCDSFYGAQKKFKDDASVAAKAYDSWGYDKAVTDKVISSALKFEAVSGTISTEQLANIAEATNRTIDGAHVDEQFVAKHYEDCSTIS